MWQQCWGTRGGIHKDVALTTTTRGTSCALQDAPFCDPIPRFQVCDMFNLEPYYAKAPKVLAVKTEREEGYRTPSGMDVPNQQRNLDIHHVVKPAWTTEATCLPRQVLNHFEAPSHLSCLRNFPQSLSSAGKICKTKIRNQKLDKNARIHG